MVEQMLLQINLSEEWNVWNGCVDIDNSIIQLLTIQVKLDQYKCVKNNKVYLRIISFDGFPLLGVHLLNCLHGETYAAINEVIRVKCAQQLCRYR